MKARLKRVLILAAGLALPIAATNCGDGDDNPSTPGTPDAAPTTSAPDGSGGTGGNPPTGPLSYNAFVIDLVTKHTNDTEPPVAVDPATFAAPPAPEADDPNAFKSILP